MYLELEEDKICARVSFVGTDRVRLSVTYPRQPKYRNRVMRALADLIRPASAAPHKMRRSSQKRERGASQDG